MVDMIAAENLRHFFQPTARTYLTACSLRTGTRFTYRISRRRPAEVPADAVDQLWFVDVLTGSNNENDYSPLAVVVRDARGLQFRFRREGARTIARSAPSAVALEWLFERLVQRLDLEAAAQVELNHEGKCGRCGRNLTTPESVALGFGPDCAETLT